MATGTVRRTFPGHARMHPEPCLYKQDRRYDQMNEITLDSGADPGRYLGRADLILTFL